MYVVIKEYEILRKLSDPEIPTRERERLLLQWKGIHRKRDYISVPFFMGVLAMILWMFL